MTGFGKAETKLATKKITVEIRSVNSKQADLSFRYPPELRQLEMPIRKLVNSELQRGKIDIFISCEQLHSEPSISLNQQLASNYWAMLQEFSNATTIPLPADPMRMILNMPGVMESESEESQEEADALEAALLKTVVEACHHLKQFRQQEGAALYSGFNANIQQIGMLLDSVAPYEEERIVEIRQRIEEGLSKYIDTDYDRSRLMEGSE